MREQAGKSVHLVRWGGFAARFASRHETAHVLAQFERSWHIAADGEIICIVAPDLGNGPLNAVVDAAGAELLSRAAPCVGATVRLGNAGQPAHDHFTLMTANATDWSPPRAMPESIRAQAMPKAIARLQALARTHASQDGLALIAFGCDGSDSPLDRVARPRLARLAEWLAGDRDMTPPTDLLGLGPGLTPSGDDVLCGVLVALHAVGRSADTRALGTSIAAVAPALTSPLSCAYLAAAAEGQAAESLHLAVNAVLAGDLQQLPRLVIEVGRHGHTSGWDALAGAVMVLKSA